MLADYQLFDAHLHIIEPGFPLIPNNGYLPDEFTCSDYLSRMQNYDLAGGAIVSGSFQGFDQTYFTHALERLGKGFVGVTQLPVQVTDQEIIDLNHVGVRAVRFNLYRGGSEELRHLKNMAQRVFDLVGWHVELYVDSSELAELFNTISALPRVSIDHLGLSQSGFSELLKLVEHGVQIKACGFSRGDMDVATALQRIHRINPAALMFGTDLPSTRAPVAFCDDDFRLVIDVLGEHAARDVFYHNAINFYKPNSNI